MQTEVEIMNPYACKSTEIISEKGTIFSRCLRNMQTNQTQRHVLHVFLSKKTWLHVHHANIVQMVKNCYKIKIDYRESKSRFYVSVSAMLDIHVKKNIAQAFILERYFFVSICPAAIPGTCLSVFLAAVLPLC